MPFAGVLALPRRPATEWDLAYGLPASAPVPRAAHSSQAKRGGQMTCGETVWVRSEHTIMEDAPPHM